MLGAVLAAVTVKLKVVVLVAPQLSVAVTVTRYGVPEAGPALLTVITPVPALPLKVPVKPGAEALRLATEPLSLGATVGSTVVPAPAIALLAG